MKKIFETIGLISLVCFSFFYTSEISSVIKDNDDIYKQIKSIKEQYNIEPIDAKIEGNTIIPGVSGSIIDIDKSYKKMKKFNEFNANLLVYESVKPNISVNNMYDKYIISGNKNKSNVSLIFVVNDNDNINNILTILDESEVIANFFIESNWFEKNNDLVINLSEKGHVVGVLNSSNDNIRWINSIIKSFTNQKSMYCYNDNNDNNFLDICKSNKSYTIRPNLLIKNNPLIEIKKNLENGNIISFDINTTLEKQLPLILDYIDFKGLDIVNIESLIEE